MVAKRPRHKTASQVRVSAEQIAAVPKRNAEDALRLAPGVALVQHGSEGKGHQFFLRGFDAVHGADLELTVEGIPVNEWSNVHAQGYIDLGSIVSESIASVDVTKGPALLNQGAFAMAGSANYRLGVAKTDRGVMGRYTFGTTGRHRGVVTLTAKEDATDAGEVSFLALEGVRDAGFGQNRDITRGAFTGRWRVLGGPDGPGAPGVGASGAYGQLDVVGFGHVADFALPGSLRLQDVESSRIGFFDTYDDTAKGTSARVMVGGVYNLRFQGAQLDARAYGGVRRLELLENYTGFLEDPVNGDRREQTHRAFRFGGDVGYHRHWVAGLQWHAGVGFRGGVLRQDQTQIGVDLQRLDTERDLRARQMMGHGRLGLSWRPVRRFRLAVGTRWDVAHVRADAPVTGMPGADAVRETRSGTSQALSPRLTTNYRVTRGLRVFAAYGRGFRPPEARAYSSFRPTTTGLGEELIDQTAGGGAGGDGDATGGGAASPRMSTGQAVETGFRWAPSNRFETSLSGFVTWIGRESVFDHVAGVSLDLNATRRLGVEMTVQGNPLPWLTLMADVTAVRARFVESGNPIPFAPKLQGGFKAFAVHPSGCALP